VTILKSAINNNNIEIIQGYCNIPMQLQC